MEVKPIYILLADISGYTRFIRRHNLALLHAEKIIGELMESILEQIEAPIVAHEILGDAVSFYAEDTGDPDLATAIHAQVLAYHNAFNDCEARLVSDCSVCSCEACSDIGKLSLKSILHCGEAAFTTVAGIRKISGEDVILAHRLLKNRVRSKAYVMMTKPFAARCEQAVLEGTTRHTEDCEGIGEVPVFVKDLQGESPPTPNLPPVQKLQRLMAMFRYTNYRRTIGRFLPRKTFRNLPD